MPSIHPGECLDQLSAMRSNESRYYECINYFEYLISTGEDGTEKAESLAEHRQKVSKWMYTCADAFNVERDVVYNGMNLLDRFLSSMILYRDVLPFSINEYIRGPSLQLAALTGLYIAMKLEGGVRRPVNIQAFVNFGRGLFTKEEIYRMEKRMLEVLTWRVSPPSPTAYVKRFILLLNYYHRRVRGMPTVIELDQPLEAMSEVSEYLTELAVLDCSLVAEKASTVAFSSVLIAMERNQGCAHGAEYTAFLSALESVGLFRDSEDVVICYKRLRELFEMNVPDRSMCEEEHDRSQVSSPVSVAQF